MGVNRSSPSPLINPPEPGKILKQEAGLWRRKDVQSHHRRTFVMLTSLLVAAIAYATLRYHVLKGIPWDQFPLFILNKAVALFSIGVLGVVHCAEPRQKRWPGCATLLLEARPTLVRVGLGSAILHSLMSLLVLRPDYFPAFFWGEVFTSTGGFALLAGLFALVLFLVLALPRTVGVKSGENPPPQPAFAHSATAAFYLVGLHSAIIGWSGWFALDWPGGLPPITLLSVLIVVGASLVRCRGRLE